MKWNDLENRLLADPKVKAEFDRLEPEFELARSLIRQRLKKDLTQEELAQKVGTHPTRIARIENPEREQASILILKKIADALDAKLVIRFEPK